MEYLAWLIPWEPSLLVVVCTVLAATFYVRGALHSPRTAPWPRQLAWWLGLGLIYVGLHTHLDYLAQHQFFVHRLQHLGLHHLGPFLIALAHPWATLRRGLPVRWRSRWLNPVLAWAPVRRTVDVLMHPLVASILFVGLIYLWLYYPVHFIVMLDVHWYKLMNYSMAIDGLLFWWLILDPRPKPPARLGPGMRVLVALAVAPPQIVLGAYITFADTDLYPIYTLCGRVMAGLDPMVDQHIGGLILWIPSAMMSAIAALIAFRNWVSLDTRHRLPGRKQQQRREHRPIG